MERLPRTWVFVYDPFDRLIKRSVDPDGAGPQPATVTWTAYDGVHPYADFNGSGTLTNRYLYGPAIDMILARVDSSSNITWHLTDHLGSVRDYANSFGQVTDHVMYGSYGNIISAEKGSGSR